MHNAQVSEGHSWVGTVLFFVALPESVAPAISDSCRKSSYLESLQSQGFEAQITAEGSQFSE